MSNANDELALKLTAVINAEEATLAKLSKPSFETNMLFVSGETKENLNTVKDVNRLVAVYAHIRQAAQSFFEAAKELGVNAEFYYNGFSWDQWKSDISIAIQRLTIKERKDALNAKKSRLESLMSPELKVKMELEAIEKEFGKK